MPTNRTQESTTAIARRIRAAREHAGMNQGEFAKVMGTARRRVVAWETGENLPPILILQTIREVCGVDPEWIVCGPGETPLEDVTNHHRQQAANTLSRLTDALQRQGTILPEETIAALADTISSPNCDDAEIQFSRMVRTIETLSRHLPKQDTTNN